MHRLRKENLKIRLETKNEKERIRESYETIALGQSRSGIMVREAMGSSGAAETIMQELNLNHFLMYIRIVIIYKRITFAIHFFM